MRSTRLITFRNLRRVPELWRCAQQVVGWKAFTRRFMNPAAGAYPYEIQTRSGIKVILNDWADVTTAWAVFCRREYPVPSHSKLIVDLGANIGLFTLFASIKAPTARFLSLEPFPATFERLRRQLERNGIASRVKCVQAAVAAATGLRDMDAEPDTITTRAHCA